MLVKRTLGKHELVHWPLRYNLNSVENSVKHHTINQLFITESDRAKVRGHINKFLEVVLQHVRDDNVRDDELAAALLKEIHHVINHIGRISEIKELAFHTALLQVFETYTV